MEGVSGRADARPGCKAAYDFHASEREIARALMAQRIVASVIQKEASDKRSALQGDISRMERQKGGSAVATLKRLCSAEYIAGDSF